MIKKILRKRKIHLHFCTVLIKKIMCKCTHAVQTLVVQRSVVYFTVARYCSELTSIFILFHQYPEKVLLYLPMLCPVPDRYIVKVTDW